MIVAKEFEVSRGVLQVRVLLVRVLLVQSSLQVKDTSRPPHCELP